MQYNMYIFCSLSQVNGGELDELEVKVAVIKLLNQTNIRFSHLNSDQHFFCYSTSSTN